MNYSRMFCANKLVALCLVFSFSTVCVGAQKRRRKTATASKVPVAVPAQKPSTLLGCGVSMKVPPGWELSVARKREVNEAQVAPTPDSNSDPTAGRPAADTESALPQMAKAPDGAAAVEMAPCSFVLAPKAPSALVKNTETEGPIGEMELRVVDGNLESAAANLFQKDDKGWYAQDSKGTRADAKLTKQKMLQILTAVIVQRCYDKSGKSRGLCESNKYVYSNGRKNLLIIAGPYLGETEYSILNSIRFVGTSTTRPRAKR
jgi:hypothetical protein